MQELYESADKKEILDKCFDYLVQKGFEQVSVQNFHEETGILNRNIDYCFKDKNEMILVGAKYGLGKIMDEMFNYALINSDDLMNKFSDEVMKFKNELRFIYQVVMSEQYGDDMRKIYDTLKMHYDIYGQKLSDKMNVPYEKLKPCVHLFISSILKYAILEDYELMQTELEYICQVSEKIKK